MSDHLIAIAILLVVFTVGTLRPVNLGILALVATFAVGSLVAGESVREMLAGFPPDLFVLLAGVTYLFGIATVNGTVEWLVDSITGIVGKNAVWIPWVIFFLAAVPTVIGALGPAGVAMLSPIALRLAEKYEINSRLAGLMLVHGGAIGNFSPINPLGVIVNGTMERNGLTPEPLTLFAANLGYNVALGVVIYLCFGGLELLRRRKPAIRSVSGKRGAARRDEAVAPKTKATPVRVITLLALLAVAIGAIVFKMDVGMLAITAAALLHLFFPASSKGATAKISWSVVMLICGIVTYMGLLQRMGTINFVGSSVANAGEPLLASLLICVVAAISSAFASSAGVLGALIPLAVPLLQTGNVPVIGVVIGLALSATIVDATPFSTVGALVVANCRQGDTDGLFREMLLWGLAMVATVPIVAWLVFILPG